MSREPKRMAFDYANWERLPEAEIAGFFAACDKEMDAVGVVVLAEAIAHEDCDAFVELINGEIRRASPIERLANERRIQVTGPTVYNMQARHPKFMAHIAYRPVIDYFRRFLGAGMTLYSCEGRVTPPGTGDGNWHHDGHERIPNYYMTMNSLHYLCDSNKENGATRYIPGTHKEFIPVADAAKREAKYIDVKKGDIVLFNPYLIHSGSANRTGNDRPIIINYYCRPYMKTEFNYPRMMSYVEASKLTEDQRRLLGFEQMMLEDLHELYRLGSCRKALADMNPYGF
ncbi:MAG: phytanoyl-CoA dioxygenase family protein [Paenibacillaceae bacterium]|nr:phytanoyl-CoA dioxygenase family protein [Paenibacillaceae bacterium]